MSANSVSTYLGTLVTFAINKLSRDDIAQIAIFLMDARRYGRRVFLLGNGGSASTASHIANDLLKAGVRAIALTDNAAVVTAIANDDGYERIFSTQLNAAMEPGDIVICLTTSGKSLNVIYAAMAARAGGGTVIVLSGELGHAELRKAAQVYITIPDATIGQQEDCHLIIGHALAAELQERK